MVPSFSEVVESIRGELDRVEKALREYLKSDVVLIPSIGNYMSDNGGKRIRPMLVLLSARACGYEGERSITHSCVVEYIHTATLLHDDVVDGAQVRRGFPSANAKWGNEASVLVGDYLFARSFHLMSADDDLRIMQVLSDASVSLAEGEVLQLVNMYNLEATEEDYLRIIFRKTAALISSCCRVGAILGRAESWREEALAEYGRHVGYAFQMADDALDYTASAERLGKAVGNDLREGNVTLPLLHLFREADEGERRLIKEIFLHSEEGDERGLNQIRSLMERYGSIEYTLEKARGRVARAREALSPLKENFYVNALHSLAEYVVERDF